MGAVLFFVFFREKQIYADLRDLPPLKIGDWVFRMGKDADSHIIRQLSGGEFSHIGMVIELKPEILVIHATTAEKGQNPKNGVLITPLKIFFAADRSSKNAVIRPLFLNEQQKQNLVSAVKKHLAKDFVLTSKNKPHLYCTTLITEEIQRIQPNFAPQWKFLNVPVLKGEYLFPNALINYPKTQKIYYANPK